ncbi:MAG: hypothetical protein IAE84_01630 [Saprospiraceae bacterium]|nr:hypothetical protein [Saprospiraceae bacterium]
MQLFDSFLHLSNVHVGLFLKAIYTTEYVQIRKHLSVSGGIMDYSIY